MNQQDQEVNLSYCWMRVSKAIQTLNTHPDFRVRNRAQQKIKRWNAFYTAVMEGKLTIGSRTPVTDTPAWVTLEVAHGGFATGRYLAETEIEEDELHLLANVPAEVVGATARERLNVWFLSDQGLAYLTSLITTRKYRIDLPEHGALLVVAWLFDNGLDEQALDVIIQLRPLMHRLRFYPYMEDAHRSRGSVVRLDSIQEVATRLQNIVVSKQIDKMHTTLNGWTPLYDRLVSLWLETVEGPPPHLQKGTIIGGWPASKWPAKWGERREKWLQDYRHACTVWAKTGRHHHHKSNFSRLLKALVQWQPDGKLLSGSVASIRLALANTVTKHGLPGSESREKLRQTQRQIGARATYAQLAHLLAERMLQFPKAGGLSSLDIITMKTTEEEQSRVPFGSEVPPHLIRKASRALEAPIAELVERGIISSAEVLAIVLPQITAQVSAIGIQDTALRDVYGGVYAAFRRRRSLLLLNLEHQVSIDELPWVKALDSLRTTSSGAEVLAIQTLEEAAQLAISGFPHTILPNPLIREFASLGKSARLNLPFVYEVAADIFMGTFSQNWLRAAKVASKFLHGTLYAKYYDLPSPDEFESGSLSECHQQWGQSTATGFAALCHHRSKEAIFSDTRSVARNGVVLEQSQILTTHNWALLIKEMGLRKTIQQQAPGLLDDIFTWFVRQYCQPINSPYRTKLQMVKNTAYAWRQAIFLLSFVTVEQQADKLYQLQRMVQESSSPYKQQVNRVIEGALWVSWGCRFDDQGQMENGRRLLGWSVGRHWVLDVEKDS